jgi:predicted phage baseplate assembly protein
VLFRSYSEARTIFGLDGADRAYMVRFRWGGAAEVQFAGHLPSGALNVTALYRNGGGSVGNLGSERLSTMLTPVLGVKSVTNPVPCDGGSDPEGLQDMRRAAPKSIRTLDRVVSLADFEAFAQGYRGIGKALASELAVGMRRVVCLTIATTNLVPPTPGSDLVTGLSDALVAVDVPGRKIRVEGFIDLEAKIGVALALDASFVRADVERAVRAALGRDFGRASRGFGEALARSAVLASVQRVDGVVAARLDTFALPAGPAEADGRLLCPAPSFDASGFKPAGLLSINPDNVSFTEMQP